MTTTKIKKSNSPDQEYLIENAPYTVFGSTPIPESNCITMKAGGLRAMLDKYNLDGEDVFRIELFPGTKATEYSFIKHQQP